METTVSHEIVTEEIRKIAGYIEATWPQFTTRKEVRLRELFPEPENAGLHHIWKYGSADLVVYRCDRTVCIIEAGGPHHFEEKQSLNDRRKWKLAELNGVGCLTMMNGLMDGLSKRKWRNLLGCYLFPKSTMSRANASAKVERVVKAEKQQEEHETS